MYLLYLRLYSFAMLRLPSPTLLKNQDIYNQVDCFNMTHLITGNKFDPNKDIPDLSGKASQEPKAALCCNYQKNNMELTASTRCTSSPVAQQGSASASRPIFSNTMPPRSCCYRKRKSTPRKRQKSSRSTVMSARSTGCSVIYKT